MIMNRPTTITNGWLPHYKPHPEAKLRLFCFAHSGAGASTFFPWMSQLPSTFEICPVQLPGREMRLAEPPFRRIKPLIETLGPILCPFLDRPFAFFGHSMGALICFELARYLRRQYGLTPAHLIVSGHRAPQVPDADSPFHTLPEPDFIEKLRDLNGTSAEVLADPELLSLLLPTLRADFELCETYAYQSEAPLECPITAFNGLQDKNVSREEANAWSEQTKATFKLRMFPGDHFYLKTHQPLVLRMLTQELHTISNSLSLPEIGANNPQQWQPSINRLNHPTVHPNV